GRVTKKGLVSSFRRVISPLLELPGVGRLVLAPVARAGYKRYRESGATPRRAYVAMRKLYAADPSAFERLAAEARTEHAQLVLPDDPDGILHGRLDAALQALDTDGLYVLPEPLAAADCADLFELASRAECTVVDPTIDPQ